MRYRRKKNKGAAIAGILSVFLLIGVLISSLAYFARQQDGDLSSKLPNIEGLDLYLVPSETEADMIKSGEEVTYYINMTPEISKGTGTFVVDNSKGNQYYLAAELTDPAGIVIYRSGIVPPGYRTEKPAVAVATAEGESASKMVVSVIDPTSFEVVATQEHGVTLTMK